LEENWRTPEPSAQRNVSGGERAAINDLTSDEDGEQGSEKDGAEKKMTRREAAERGGGRNAAERTEILRESFSDEDDEKHGVDVIDVEHQAGDKGENEPLKDTASEASFVPVPHKKRDDEGRMCVGPRGIEVHVNGKRAGPPNGEGGEEGPDVRDEFASEPESEKEAEETVKAGGKGHGEAVGSGETVCGNRGTQSAGEENGNVGEDQEWGPENSGTDGEMIVEVSGGSAEAGANFAVLIDASVAKSSVGGLIVVREIEAVFDERRAREGIVADAVAANPGIEKRQREKKKNEESAFSEA